MKYSFSLLLTAVLVSCSSSTKIVASWVNKEAVPTEPYKSIYIIALTGNKEAKLIVESKLEELILSRGRKAVRSEYMFTPTVSSDNHISKEQMTQIIKESGCDAVLTISLLDVKTDEHYQAGTTYAPYGYGFYGTYYGYYDNISPQVATEGYYVDDKTYYMETNFYDAQKDKLVWSIQSSTYDPEDLDAWFKDYSRTILKELKREGLVKK